MIDLDSTLNNLVWVWIQELNKKYGTNVQYDDIKEYDLSKAFPSLTIDELYSPLQENNFWTLLSPIDGSQKYLKKLIDEGHQIKIVTATHYKNLEIKMNWLLTQFPFLKWKDVWVVHDKQSLRADYLIDDCYGNLIGGSYKKICLDQPWNRNFQDANFGVIRAYSFKQIYHIITQAPSCGKTKWDFGCLECSHGFDDDGTIYCGIKLQTNDWRNSI